MSGEYGKEVLQMIVDELQVNGNDIKLAGEKLKVLRVQVYAARFYAKALGIRLAFNDRRWKSDFRCVKPALPQTRTTTPQNSQTDDKAIRG